MVAPLKRDSFSRIDTFAGEDFRCERKYFLDCKAPRPTGARAEALNRGTKLHDMMEQIALGMIQGRSPREAWEALDESVRKDHECVDYFNRIYDARYFDAIQPQEVELWVDGLVRPATKETLAWVGKVDLISATLPLTAYGELTGESVPTRTVLDYKFVGKPWKVKDVAQAQRSLQLKSYCLATGATRAGFVFVLPEGPPRVVTVEFSKKELDLAWRWVYHVKTVVAARWAQLADDHSNWKEVFSIASPGHKLCCEKWCEGWKQCLGGKHD